MGIDGTVHQPPESSGWIVKLDKTTGKILGYVPVNETPALHCRDLTGEGQPMTGVGNKVIVFKSRRLLDLDRKLEEPKQD